MSAPGGQVSVERLSENNLPQQLVRGRLLDADEGGDDLKREAARVVCFGVQFLMPRSRIWTNELASGREAFEFHAISRIAPGGTFLSKAYGVIRRFSEDVDLTYNHASRSR